MLEYFDVSISDDYFVNALQRDLCKLAKQIHGHGSVEIHNPNDRVTCMVRVPRTKTLKRCLIRATKTKWVGDLLDGMLPWTTFFEDNKLDIDVGDKIGGTRKDSARWLIYLLGREYKDKFVIAAEKLMMPCHT